MTLWYEATVYTGMHCVTVVLLHEGHWETTAQSYRQTRSRGHTPPQMTSRPK